MTTRFTAFVQHGDVVDVVGVEDAERGWACFEGGHVFNTRQKQQKRQGHLRLWALCAGDQSPANWVSVSLRRGGVTGSRCSCISRRACEHVAALLYAWIYDPDIFEEREDWRDVVESWSKEQLLAVVFSLADQSADVDALLQAEAEGDQYHLFEKDQDLIGLIGHAAPLWQVPELADELIEDGYAEQAESLIIKRIGEGQSGVLVDWLIEYYERVSDYASALIWAHRRLEAVPSAAYYATVWSIAQRVGVWEELRPVLLMRLKRDCFSESIKALILEGRLVESLDEYERGVEQGKTISDATRLRVAEIAESVEPERAVMIYSELVDGLLERRSREYYRIAAHLLGRIEFIYGRLGRKSDWYLMFSDFIARNSRRPVLFEELERAELLEID